jgi:hypothetical protein
VSNRRVCLAALSLTLCASVSGALSGCGGGSDESSGGSPASTIAIPSSAGSSESSGRYSLGATAECLEALPLKVARNDVNPFAEATEGNMLVVWSDDVELLFAFGKDRAEATRIAAKLEEIAAALAPLGVGDVVEQEENVVYYTAADTLPEQAKRTVRACLAAR